MSGMQVLRLEAGNIKRLRAVALNLEGGKNLVVVGKPDAGKTTALDLAWMAFRARAIGPETISAGADEARITVVIGNPERQYTITRKLTRDGEPSGQLKVKCSDGGTYGAKFLDTLISDLTFDPTVFARAEGKAQTDLLLQVVKLPGGVSIDSLDRSRETLYEQRRVINRDLDRAKAKLPEVEPEAVESVNIDTVLSDIESQLEAMNSAAKQKAAALRVENREKIEQARGVNQANAAMRAKLEGFRAKRDQIEKATQEVENQITELQLKLKNLQRAAVEHDQAIAQGEGVVAGLVDTDIDSLASQLDAEEAAIDQKLKGDAAPLLAKRATAVKDAEAMNAKARARQAWEKDKAEFDKTKAESEALTAKIADVDARKKSLLESVEWPVPGLSIRDGQVTYKDTILSQCGMSVRMRVSCAIAMALNPKLKAIRIDEGESLGEEGRQELFAWAAERGYQVLMSVVKDGPAAEGELEIIDDTLTNEQPAEVAAVAHG